MRGHIDFSTFDPYDWWAWKKLRMVLRQLEAEHLQQTCDVDFRYYTALAASKYVTSESGKHCIEQADITRKRLVRAYKTWLPREDADTSSAVKSIADKHRELFGSPGSPEYEAMLAELRSPRRTPAQIAAEELKQAAAARRAMLKGSG